MKESTFGSFSGFTVELHCVVSLPRAPRRCPVRACHILRRAFMITRAAIRRQQIFPAPIRAAVAGKEEFEC